MKLFVLLVSVATAFSQLDLCEPAVDPSPACLCTRLDFMDTYSYRLRFGNSSFAGSNYIVSVPTFNSNYDCSSEEPLQCSGSSSSATVAAFAVFNMKHVLKLPSRIPNVFCYPNIRMFDMDGSTVKQFQSNGDLPADELSLHLTEVGCIEYSASEGSSPGSGAVTTPISGSESSKPPTTDSPVSAVPAECNCPLPPATMTQSLFNYRFAWQFPKTKYEFGTPQFVFSDTCQSVTMLCKFPVSSVLLNEKQSQTSLMFFNEEYMISGNDIRDVASRFNLHCDSASGTWKFDSASETKFKSLLGVDAIQLTELGCATVSDKS